MQTKLPPPPAAQQLLQYKLQQAHTHHQQWVQILAQEYTLAQLRRRIDVLTQQQAYAYEQRNELACQLLEAYRRQTLEAIWQRMDAPRP